MVPGVTPMTLTPSVSEYGLAVLPTEAETRQCGAAGAGEILLAGPGVGHIGAIDQQVRGDPRGRPRRINRVVGGPAPHPGVRRAAGRLVALDVQRRAPMPVKPLSLANSQPTLQGLPPSSPRPQPDIGRREVQVELRIEALQSGLALSEVHNDVVSSRLKVIEMNPAIPEESPAPLSGRRIAAARASDVVADRGKERRPLLSCSCRRSAQAPSQLRESLKISASCDLLHPPSRCLPRPETLAAGCWTPVVGRSRATTVPVQPGPEDAAIPHSALRRKCL